MANQSTGEPRRRPRPEDQRESLRRLTLGAAVAATVLNALLFAQTGVAQLGPGGLQDAIASAISAFFPGANLRPPAKGPGPAPAATPVAVSGGS